MLVELAVGDAYGRGFEFAPRKFVREANDLSSYRSYRPSGREGSYTDDTQMSLAIAEAIVSGDPLTPGAIADRFVDAYKRDPRPGYASGFRQFLESVDSGEEFLERIRPRSRRCGAAKRAPPIGVLRDPTDVRELAEMQARLTHDTIVGRRSAAAVALMAHFCVYRVDEKRRLRKWLGKHIAGSWDSAHKGKVGMQGCQVVRAALTALTSSGSMSEILRRCVDFTGDVDTVAAIALAAASCSPEVENDLPAHLVRNLEDGEYGRPYLEEVDDRLMAMT